MIRNSNEYRQTKENNISILLTKTGNSARVYNTQIPFLKKHTWYNYNDTLATLIDDDIVTIEKYLSCAKNIYLHENKSLPNNNLTKITESKCQKVIKEKIRSHKVYYNRKENRYCVVYFIGNIKKKRSYSCNKYGNEVAKKKAENFIELKKKMI